MVSVFMALTILLFSIISSMPAVFSQQVPPNYFVYGNVTNSTGGLVPAGVTVYIDDTDIPTTVTDDTDANGFYQRDIGSFAIPGLAIGHHFTVNATHQGESGSSSFVFDPVTNPTQRCEIQLGEAAPAAPSVTVIYPNGGEGFLPGASVVVSARATDNTQVASVVFNYSSNGGTTWEAIGAGSIVSGNATDGIWNATWDTTGLTKGSYLIKATATDTSGSTGLPDTSNSIFYILGVTTITVTPSPKILNIGETQQFSATAKDQLVNTLAGITFTWSSSDTYIGTINATGLFTAKHSGTTTVSAVNDSVTGTAIVTVLANGSISGKVTDSVTGTGISGVTVTADGISTQTAAKGYYTISLNAGTYTVSTSKSGYISQTQTGVTVTSGEPTTGVDFALVRDYVEIALKAGETTTKVGNINGNISFNLTVTNHGDPATYGITNSSTDARVFIEPTTTGLLLDGGEKCILVNINASINGSYPVTISAINSSKSANIKIVALALNASADGITTGDSTQNNSELLNGTIVQNNSVVNDSAVTSSVVDNSTVTDDATVTDSFISEGSTVTGGEVTNSAVINATITNSTTVTESKVENSVATNTEITGESEVLEGSDITGGTIASSTVTNVTANNTDITAGSVVENTVVIGGAIASSNVTSSTAASTTVTGSTLVGVTATGCTIDDVTLENIELESATVTNVSGEATIKGGTSAKVNTSGEGGVEVHFENVYEDIPVEDLVKNQTIPDVVPANMAVNTTPAEAKKVGASLSVNSSVGGNVTISKCGINPGGSTFALQGFSGDITGDYLHIDSTVPKGTSMSVTLEIYYGTSEPGDDKRIVWYNEDTEAWESKVTTKVQKADGWYLSTTLDHLSIFAIAMTTAAAAPVTAVTAPGGGVRAAPPINVPIDPETGAITSTTTLTVEKASLTIPEGTIVEDAEGNPLVTSITTLHTPSTAKTVGAITAYDFGPSGTRFSPPIDLVIEYDPADIPAGFSESDLVVKMYDGTAWIDLDTTVYPDANTATAKVSHFTIFALFAAPPAVVTPTAVPTAKPTIPPVTPIPTPPVVPPVKRPWGLIIGIIIAVIVVGAAAYYFYTKKKA